jgi:hypothetical protein
MAVREEQPVNTPLPILVTFGKFTVVRAEQPTNTPSPTLVTLSFVISVMLLSIKAVRTESSPPLF